MSLSQPAHAQRPRITARTVGIALLGCGTVGGGVARLLAQNAQPIAEHGGADFALRRVAVRTLSKPRAIAIDAALLTDDPFAALDDPDVDLVVECIGGNGIAAELVERALSLGKHVVTANKDMVATQGPRLAAIAERTGASLHYEAAVGGAIPIVRALSDSLAGEDVLEVGGVLNGTTNFILSEMERGAAYASALAEAQRLGFAEADPTSDVEGIDTAHKLAILSQLAFRRALVTPMISRRGISSISRDDVSVASRLEMRIKLIATARVDGAIEGAVTPAYVRLGHPFAEPAGSQNAIRVIGRSSGSLTFAGHGAGQDPTASAVIGDVIAALRRIAGSRHETIRLTEVDAGTIPAPRMPHIVRLASFRDVRPAHAALAEAGIVAEPHRDTPCVITTSISLDRNAELQATLRAAHIEPASIIPLFQDEP